MSRKMFVFPKFNYVHSYNYLNTIKISFAEFCKYYNIEYVITFNQRDVFIF